MIEANPRLAPPDLSCYEENRTKFPLNELAKYAGQYVAFSSDGTRVVASGKSWEELWENLETAGIDPSHVVGSFVPPLDMTVLL